MTPELEASAEVRKTGHKWIDITVAACALIVSVTSLGVAIFHGKTMERMADANARLVAANSWPALQRLSSSFGRDGSHVVSMNVTNNGVGPAKIEAVELLWKGRALRDANELIDACCRAAALAAYGAMAENKDAVGNGTPLHFFGYDLVHSSVQGIILRAGENIRLYELRPSDHNKQLFEQLDNAYDDIAMRVCYCSVFDECWRGDLRTLNPEPIKQCVLPAVTFH